jgi:hypothetical protein
VAQRPLEPSAARLEHLARLLPHTPRFVAPRPAGYEPFTPASLLRPQREGAGGAPDAAPDAATAGRVLDTVSLLGTRNIARVSAAPTPPPAATPTPAAEPSAAAAEGVVRLNIAPTGAPWQQPQAQQPRPSASGRSFSASPGGSPTASSAAARLNIAPAHPVVSHGGRRPADAAPLAVRPLPLPAGGGGGGQASSRLFGAALRRRWDLPGSAAKAAHRPWFVDSPGAPPPPEPFFGGPPRVATILAGDLSAAQQAAIIRHTSMRILNARNPAVAALAAIPDVPRARRQWRESGADGER